MPQNRDFLSICTRLSTSMLDTQQIFGMYRLLLSTVERHLMLEYGAGTEVLRMLMGCATALPVEGDKMSSPPPNSVISCNNT